MEFQNKGFKNRILNFMSGCYNRIPERLTNTLYIVALALFLLYDYNFLTRFPREPFQKLYIAGAGLGCIVLAIRFLNIQNEDRMYLLVSLLLLLAGLGYYLVRGSYYFLVLAIFMVGARHVSDRSILTLYVILAGSFFALMVGHYFQNNGVLANDVRSNFGGINTTDTQAMLFFIMVAYLFVRGRNIKLIELAVFAVLTIWFWQHTYAENNMFCAMAGILLAVLMKICVGLYLKFNKGSNILMYFSITSFIICGFIMIIAVAKYDSNNATWVRLDRLLHSRLSFAQPVFFAHPPCVWGSDFMIVGHGYDPSQNTWENLNKYGHTYIDSSYPQILIVHGYIIYAMIIGAMTAVARRYADRKDLYRVLLLAVIAIDCMAEGHLKEISCNIWLLCLFADIHNSNKLSMNQAIQSTTAEVKQR